MRRILCGAIRGRIEVGSERRVSGSARSLRHQREAQLAAETDPLPALHALLDLPLRLEESGGFRALIALDESRTSARCPRWTGSSGATPVPGDVASYDASQAGARPTKQLFETKEVPLDGAAVPVRRGACVTRTSPSTSWRGSSEQAQRGGGAEPVAGLGQGPPAAGDAARARLCQEVERGGRLALDDGSARTVRPSTS